MNAIIANAEIAAIWWAVPIVGAFIWRKSLRELCDLFRRNVKAKEALVRQREPAPRPDYARWSKPPTSLTDEDWSD